MRSSVADAPLVVSTNGVAGPYITVTTNKLQPVIQALQAQGIPFEVDDDAVVLDGKPALSLINLGRGVDVDGVKTTLDDLVADWRGTIIKAGAAATSQNGLIVRFDTLDRTEVLHRLESAHESGWTRRPEFEERMRKTRAMDVGANCFAKNFQPIFGEVAVWLQPQGAKELFISSIIALSARRSLTMAQYNQALDDFEKSFIERLSGCEGKVGRKVRVSGWSSNSRSDGPFSPFMTMNDPTDDEHR